MIWYIEEMILSYKLSIKEIAKITDIKPRVIQNLINKKTKELSYQNSRKILRAYFKLVQGKK